MAAVTIHFVLKHDLIKKMSMTESGRQWSLVPKLKGTSDSNAMTGDETGFL